jgi:hypothetical protein
MASPTKKEILVYADWFRKILSCDRGGKITGTDVLKEKVGMVNDSFQRIRPLPE